MSSRKNLQIYIWMSEYSLSLYIYFFDEQLINKNLMIFDTLSKDYQGREEVVRDSVSSLVKVSLNRCFLISYT